MPGYTWAKQRDGAFQERPAKGNDDACDALRYGVMAFEPDLEEGQRFETYEERVEISPY